ncbi:DUF819 family protein [Sphingobacterium hungaricum]|uniref:DUF819 domain-containing protein n=1 Tax=Sphingobacterium hungaricum TaxID=2082723 RepID=A0A928UTU7_9SPHI|nr:DUF819 family protein [Sphingobacterium hungaricum]MBE8712627.1 hypothetical protein [Sphingobacterium hungaricum]
MQDIVSTSEPLITDTAAVFGLLMLVLAVVFYTSGLSNKYIKNFYAVIPPLLLCYFIPGILNSTNVIDGENSPLTSIGSRYFLPACLILFTLSLDLKQLWSLRKRAGLMFITGTVGIILGGPLAVWLVSLFAPDVVGGVGPEEVWKGLGSLAGSWIGGSANQVALKEILEPSPKLFSSIIAVDVFVAYIWMALLLYGASKNEKMNAYLKADDSDVKALMSEMEKLSQENTKIPQTRDYLMMLGLAFAGTGLASLLAAPISEYMTVHHPGLAKFSLTNNFFWLVLFATIFGIALSFTKAKKLEHAGASKVGSVLLYMLIVTIGMQMDIMAILQNPGLFLVGIIWISFHALLLILMARLIKAPFFYLAVGSMANVGGVASATVTAGAFHTSLVPIGVILAVFGYAIGTYLGWLCAILMQMVSPI